MRVKSVDDKQAFVMFFRPVTDPAAARELANVRKMLHLTAEGSEFTVTYGSFSVRDTEIALLSRSMLQVMVDIASYIDVPETDVAEGRVYATNMDNSVQGQALPPLVKIRCSEAEPQDSYVSVSYRVHWFWIDDRDYPSKRMFTFLMFLFSLTETDTQGNAPIVTVPTN